jgi:protein-tyrosine phosphatase
MNKVSVCFVCLGNICRSPTAEAVMLRMVDEAGLNGRVVVDSAGTGNWHVGEAPDERAQRAGKQRATISRRCARARSSGTILRRSI